MTDRFKEWFLETMRDADGNYNHLPDWLEEDMRRAWDAALSVPTPGTGEAEGNLVQCGWAYQDKRWDADRWHVCGFDSKPREHDGRIVRPLYVELGRTALASEGGGR